VTARTSKGRGDQETGECSSHGEGIVVASASEATEQLPAAAAGVAKPTAQ
jgi:hypothetical protein